MTLHQDSTNPTGISDDTPRGNTDVHRARERKTNAALAMSIEGYDWDEIASSLGYPTARAARVAVENSLERQLATDENKRYLRGVASKKIDRLSQSVMRKALNENHPEHLNAVKEARGLLDRWIKLHGLDAPTEISVTSPTYTELERWVGTVVARRNPELAEASIFDDDVVEAEIVNDPSTH